MEQQSQFAAAIEAFRLPRYQEIPDVGLYLEQVVKYLSDYLAPLTGMSITGPMIANYVKKKLVANPVKKQYGREQIAQLAYIAVVKSVASIDDIHLMLDVQRGSYPTQQAYDYFCTELENVLQYVFGCQEPPEAVNADADSEKYMLRSIIITVAHKVYLNALFQAMRQNGGPG